MKRNLLAQNEKPLSRSPRCPRLTLSVTDELIAAAIPKNSSHCMYADAIKRAFPRATGISVDIQTIRFSDPKKRLRYVYLTPRLSQIGLIDFDQGREIKPHDVRIKGGMVIGMGSTQSQKGQTTKPRRKQGSKLKKPRLVQRQTGLAPDVVGGRAPPRFSMRREYGLRALER